VNIRKAIVVRAIVIKKKNKFFTYCIFYGFGFQYNKRFTINEHFLVPKYSLYKVRNVVGGAGSPGIYTLFLWWKIKFLKAVTVIDIWSVLNLLGSAYKLYRFGDGVNSTFSLLSTSLRWIKIMFSLQLVWWVSDNGWVSHFHAVSWHWTWLASERRLCSKIWKNCFLITRLKNIFFN